jgi:dihydroorotate dehydrogenase (fumarate)
MSVDLSTTYLTLRLKSPLVVSAGPMTDRPHLWKELEESGAAALVLPSLFEEQIEHDEWQSHQLHQFGTESFFEALDYFPAIDDHRLGPSQYLRKIEDAKREVTIPVIGSLNGVSAGGWARYARLIEEAGADAIELNIYSLPIDPRLSGSACEDRYIELVKQIREQVRVPLAVKIGPFFSALPHMACRLEEAGADGLVLFNRLFHSDIDLERLEFINRLELSHPSEARLSVHWLAILREHVRLSLAANGGMRTVEDIIKAVLVGADATQVLAVLLELGPGHLRRLEEGLLNWLNEHGYASIEQMKGSMCRAHCSNPESLDRVNYMRILHSYSGPNW